MSTVDSQASRLNSTAGALLGLLDQLGPVNGNALFQQAQQLIGGFWTVTRSQVYSELRALDERGFVRTGDVEARSSRPIRITAAGRRAFRAWLHHGPDDSVIRVPLLLSVRFAAMIPPARLAEIIEEFRAHHEATLEAYLALERDAGAVMDHFERATLRFGILHERAVAQWLDELPGLLPDDS